MTTNHDAVAALPVGAATNKQLLRDLVTRRMPYVLGNADDATTLDVVDPASGAAVIDILYLGRVFHYDATDTTTAHDGVTCLVSHDGHRFKLASGTDVFAYAVLNNTTATPPGSPALGDAYLVAAAATGAWAGHEAAIAVYTARGWEFVDFGIGRFVYVEALDSYYHKNSAGAWIVGFGAQSLPAASVPLSAAINFGKFVIVENQTTNAPPVGPTVGQAYIIGSAPTGAWAGKALQVAICEVAGAWSYYVPGEGMRAYDKATDLDYRYNGSAWVTASGRLTVSTVVIEYPGTNWGKPARLVFAKIWCLGSGGGGTGASGGGNGSNTTFGTLVNAGGGQGPAGQAGAGSVGQVLTRGGAGFPGGQGGSGAPPWGGGNAPIGVTGLQYGGGGAGNTGAQGGGGGGGAYSLLNAADLPDLVAVTIGPGGAGGGSGGAPGFAGVCVIEQYVEA